MRPSGKKARARAVGTRSPFVSLVPQGVPSGLFLFCAAYLILAIALGGSSRPGLVADTVLQGAALPLLALALSKLTTTPISGMARPLVAIALAAVAVVGFQVVPLPPDLWTRLPGREGLVDAYAAAGMPLPWLTTSMSPASTLASLAALAPPLAFGAAALALTPPERSRLLVLLVGCVVLVILLGLAQVAAGPDSVLRFHEFSGGRNAVGTFVNRNHYGALIYLAIPFLVALTLAAMKTRLETRLVAAAFGTVVLALLILGLATSLSRAALIVGMVALSLSAPLAFALRERASSLVSTILGVATVAGLLLVLQFGMAGVWRLMEADHLGDYRFTIFEVTGRGIGQVFPVGAGFGTFVPFYAGLETADEIVPAFVNNAHNDYLQILLEGGLPGALLLAAFFAWFALAGLRAWRTSDGSAAALEARAAVIAIALLSAHALVEFHLRTASVGVAFAFACVLLANAPASASVRARSRRGAAIVHH